MGYGKKVVRRPCPDATSQRSQPAPNLNLQYSNSSIHPLRVVSTLPHPRMPYVEQRRISSRLLPSRQLLFRRPAHVGPNARHARPPPDRACACSRGRTRPPLDSPPATGSTTTILRVTPPRLPAISHHEKPFKSSRSWCWSGGLLICRARATTGSWRGMLGALRYQPWTYRRSRKRKSPARETGKTPRT